MVLTGVVASARDVAREQWSWTHGVVGDPVVLPVLVPVVPEVAVVAVVEPVPVDDEGSPVPVPVPVVVPAVPLVPVPVDEVPVEPAVPVWEVGPGPLVPAVPVEFAVPVDGVSPAAPVCVGSVVELGGVAVGTMSSPPEIGVEPVEPEPVPPVFVLVDLTTAGVVWAGDAGVLKGAW
jgi:hypothetical protein